MYFRYPVKLFLAVAAALLLSGAGYIFTTRCLIRSTQIAESASSLRGPSITIVMGKLQRPRRTADANLPQWSEIPSVLKTKPSISPPSLAAAAPAPVDVNGILGSHLSDSLPTTNIKTSELAMLPVPEQPLVSITGPAPPKVTLPKVDIKRPEIPVHDIRAGLAPPVLPAVHSDARPDGKPVPLPVDFPPEVRIVSP